MTYKMYMKKSKGKMHKTYVGNGFAYGTIMPKTKKGDFDLSKVIENVGKDSEYNKKKKMSY